MDTNYELIHRILTMSGFDVIRAVNGKEAVAITKQEVPDLILMDMSLPVMDGWEATRSIKTDNDLKQIPVIALTAHAMGGDEEKARAAGCDDYLTKPLDEDLLFGKLDHFLGE